mgnify:CR=1 FL=1
MNEDEHEGQLRAVIDQALKDNRGRKRSAKARSKVITEPILKPEAGKESELQNSKAFEDLSNDVIIGMAEACENQGAYTKARDLYFFAGERGSWKAVLQAGELAESGFLGAKDFESAFECYLLAAKAAYVPAMEIVALNYFLGIGVEKSELKSAAFIYAAHEIDPHTVRDTFNKLMKEIDPEKFKLGETYSYYMLATDDAAKDEAKRINRKVERLLETVNKTGPQKRARENDNNQSLDPVWIFPILFIGFPLLMWLIRGAQ